MSLQNDEAFNAMGPMLVTETTIHILFHRQSAGLNWACTQNVALREITLHVFASHMKFSPRQQLA